MPTEETTGPMTDISEVLQVSSARHSHLCPRQVLGARMGMAGLHALGLNAPVTKPTGLVIVETDGCFVDGMEAATGATVGHRTLRVVDMGKIAATFVDVQSSRAIRLVPQQGIRTLAFAYAPEEEQKYAVQLAGYQVMPEAELLRFEDVELEPPLSALLSRPDARSTCSKCGEEIINERELMHDGVTLCHTCAGQGYYMIRATRQPA
jgi:formylmethanofuran dehydrogenase subunit E